MILFLDACIVVYWIEASDPLRARLKARLHAQREQAPEATFVVSRLSWLGCMVKPLRENDEALVNE